MLLSEKVQRDLDIGAKYNRGKTCGTVQNFTHSNRHSNCWNLDCCSGAGKIQQSNRLDTKFHLQYYQSPEVKRTLDKMTKSAMKKKQENKYCCTHVPALYIKLDYRNLNYYKCGQHNALQKLIYSPQNQVHKSVFHKVVTGELPLLIFCSTCDVTGDIGQFKMADVSSLEELLQGENRRL